MSFVKFVDINFPYLEQHILIHTGEKTFSQNLHLKQHMLTHTGEKPSYCEVCGVTFVRNTYLKQHMVTYTGKKCFLCNDVDQNFYIVLLSSIIW